MIRQCFSRLPNISLLYSHNPLRAFVLGGLALMVLAFAGPALSQTQLGSDIDGEAADDHRALGLPVQRWHAGGDWGALTTATAVTQATCGSMSTVAVLGLSLARHRRRGGR